VLVAVPEPFDFGLTTERFRAFGDDPVNRWVDGGLHRVLGGREVRIEPADGGVRVEPAAAGLEAPVLHLLGAGFDLASFTRFAAADPVLARLAAALRGLRPAQAPDPFEMLVSSITAQQVSLRAALAIRRRFVERYGVPGRVAWTFPTREAVARAAPTELRALGFSSRKAEYTVALARSDLNLDGLGELRDAEVIERLTALPGIGVWTAEWFLARHLAREDVWPAGDLGVRKALSAFYLDGRDPSVTEARTFGGRFSPHGTLVAHHLLVGLRVLGP
jgi:DNA-3-methyladenine glycosylase II